MEKNNEILAEFIGLKPYEDNRYGTMWPGPTNSNKVGFGLKFNTSRDWFHPVWEKFRDLKFEYLSENYIYHRDMCDLIGGFITHGTLPEACEELAKGIIWYNSIKEK